ncbi:MAG TPA: site-specific DNA-methyltransferase [Microcoleaceae bacterium UBA11344]|jgi:Adenine specific DNA methylase Mod|nr:site-specific DNA-methyltransferase [Microcoleaceae cyanobacterium UBA11344]
MKRLYYGDNLQVLREHISDEFIDLIYLDPPFNSKADYNVLFKNATGERSEAQITAFEDTWTWGIESEHFLDQLRDKKGELYELLDLLVRTLGKNSLSAYLVMMAIRLLELHRVLKSTGSLYLHCDPTASHYLKMISDLVFEPINFRNEIVWKRTGSHGGAKRWGPVHDLILLYTKSKIYTWNQVYQDYDEDYVKDFYRFEDDKGCYRLVTLTAPGVRKGDSGKPWRGVNPTDVGRHWALPVKAIESLTNSIYKSLSTQEKLDILNANNLIYWPVKGQVPQYKRYLDEAPGTQIQDIISDIKPVSSQARERLGYPTQKPLALLERIIQASSNKGDIILDPFCGCGTAIHAAENLGRNWIGIDITHLAIALIEKRLKDAFPEKFIQDENKNQKLVPGIEFEVEGTPKDLDAALDLFERDPYQFQWWACSLVNAQPYKDKKKGADGGIDGLIFFEDVVDLKKSNKTAVKKIIVSVKGGKNINASMIRDLRGTMETNKADIGLFVTLTTPTKPMIKEAASSGFYKAGNGRDYAKIQILTIEELLTKQKRPEFFDMKQGELTFKKTQRENQDMGVQGELF